MYSVLCWSKLHSYPYNENKYAFNNCFVFFYNGTIYKLSDKTVTTVFFLLLSVHRNFGPWLGICDWAVQCLQIQSSTLGRLINSATGNETKTRHLGTWTPRLCMNPLADVVTLYGGRDRRRRTQNQMWALSMSYDVETRRSTLPFCISRSLMGNSCALACLYMINICVSERVSCVALYIPSEKSQAQPTSPLG